MNKWENELLKYLQYSNNEFLFKRQYFFKYRMMFEYLFKMISQKRFIEKEIDFLEKINIHSEKSYKKLSEIDRKISEITGKINRVN